ncbi:hypothetical protein [uncultured Ruthenibacterium sp.]|uniref:hypothetical protein n=1 Tax=uncultured Ruthenibacterium sp. TaxID=1905347 RepID=UPI00349E6EDA
MDPKQQMFDEVESWLAELWEISRRMYEHPELGLEENESAQMLENWLDRRGFLVERGSHSVSRRLWLGSAGDRLFV